jgi:glutathione S-transferase
VLKLYTAPGTCGLATQIALEEAGADYELVRVDFASHEQRGEDYLRLNPKSRVPTLVTDRGAISETPALLLYVAQTWPQAGLAPLNDPFALAQMQAFTNYLCATLHPARAHMYRGYRWADDPAALTEMKRKAPEVVADGYALIDQRLLAGPWVMGEAYSVADAYLFTLSNWLDRDGMDRSRFPKVDNHWRRMQERPAVRKALATGLA